MSSPTDRPSTPADPNWLDSQAAIKCDLDNIEFENNTLVIHDKVVDLHELHNHLLVCHPLGVWYMHLNGVTLVDPSSVTPHTNIVSRPWLRSLVVRDLKETAPEDLCKFLSLFQQIEELRFEGPIGPEQPPSPADEGENPKGLSVKTLIVRRHDTSTPASIAEPSPKWPGVFVVLRNAVRLSGLQAFETDVNPRILGDFLRPCHETLRSLTFSMHCKEANLDLGLGDFMQLEHVHVASVLLPVSRHMHVKYVPGAIGSALKTLASILAQVSKTDNERARLRTLEADMVYQSTSVVDTDEDSVEDRGARLLSSAMQGKAEIQAIFDTYPALRIIVKIPTKNKPLTNMLRKWFCGEKRTGRWVKRLDIKWEE